MNCKIARFDAELGQNDLTGIEIWPNVYRGAVPDKIHCVANFDPNWCTMVLIRDGLERNCQVHFLQ